MINEKEKVNMEEQLCQNHETAIYPSAEILMNICYNEYRRIHDTYNKIYEKVNIALAFCGVILIVVMSNFDYTIISRLSNCDSNYELLSLLTLIICSFVSASLVIWAVIQLLLLMRSRPMTVIDCSSFQNEKTYCEQTDIASLWVLNLLNQSILKTKLIIEEKQKSFDAAILKIVIGLLTYAVAMIIQKGV